MGRAHTIAMVATPMVAMATLALGLRIGAVGAVRAAMIYGAPAPRGGTTRVWQLVSVLEDRAVRESVPVRGLTVAARGAAGTGGAAREAVWRGDTNGDGVAEVFLDMPWLHDGDALDLEVTSRDDPAPLARGAVSWAREPSTPEAASPFLRPSKRDGDVALDLAIQGARLTPGYPTPIGVRATDRATGRPLSGVVIDAEPEPGLRLQATAVTTCAIGWAELSAEAQIHVVGLSLHARAKPEADGAPARTGDWYGSPTVAPGASYVDLPPAIQAGKARAFDVIAPTAREVSYVEVDDEVGRAFAAAVPLVTAPGGEPHAQVVLPPLGEGLHWLVTSGEPRGAESLRGAAIARPFWVEPVVQPVAPSPDAAAACELGARLATHPAPSFHRWLALDGFLGREDKNARDRRIGLVLALGSLLVAAALELLLILQGAQKTKDDLTRAARDLDDGASGATMTRRTSAGSVIIGVLVALLGFGLLASLLMWRAG